MTPEERRLWIKNWKAEKKKDPVWVAEENRKALERMNRKYRNDHIYRAGVLAKSKHRAAHKNAEVKAYQKQYKKANKEHIDKLNTDARAARKAADPEAYRLKINALAKNYSTTAAYRAYIKEYRKKRRSSPIYRLIDNNRRRIRDICSGDFKKSARSMVLIGCTEEQLRAHMESHFKPGMTWENYGYYGWHADHHKPLAAHNLNNPEEQAEAFHYTNLRPLWRVENQMKSDTWEPAITSVPARQSPDLMLS